MGTPLRCHQHTGVTRSHGHPHGQHVSRTHLRNFTGARPKLVIGMCSSTTVKVTWGRFLAWSMVSPVPLDYHSFCCACWRMVIQQIAGVGAFSHCSFCQCLYTQVCVLDWCDMLYYLGTSHRTTAAWDVVAQTRHASAQGVLQILLTVQ